LSSSNLFPFPAMHLQFPYLFVSMFTFTSHTEVTTLSLDWISFQNIVQNSQYLEKKNTFQLTTLQIASNFGDKDHTGLHIVPWANVKWGRFSRSSDHIHRCSQCKVSQLTLY
jgi:hypothetical protein